jgi:hypothetical protein
VEKKKRLDGDSGGQRRGARRAAALPAGVISGHDEYRQRPHQLLGLEVPPGIGFVARCTPSPALNAWHLLAGPSPVPTVALPQWQPADGHPTTRTACVGLCRVSTFCLYFWARKQHSQKLRGTRFVAPTPTDPHHFLAGLEITTAAHQAQGDSSANREGSHMALVHAAPPPLRVLRAPWRYHACIARLLWLRDQPASSCAPLPTHLRSARVLQRTAPITTHLTRYLVCPLFSPTVNHPPWLSRPTVKIPAGALVAHLHRALIFVQAEVNLTAVSPTSHSLATRRVRWTTCSHDRMPLHVL